MQALLRDEVLARSGSSGPRSGAPSKMRLHALAPGGAQVDGLAIPAEGWRSSRSRPGRDQLLRLARSTCIHAVRSRPVWLRPRSGCLAAHRLPLPLQSGRALGFQAFLSAHCGASFSIVAFTVAIGADAALCASGLAAGLQGAQQRLM